MTDFYSLILFLHILSLVFWLGTDVGVFTLGKFAQNPAYSIDQRLLLLKVALILDMFPRVFMVLTLPTGFQLGAHLGLLPSTPLIIAGVWIFSACWLAVVLVGLLKDQTPTGGKAKVIEKAIQFFLIVSLAGVGGYSLLAGEPILVSWLAWKVLMYTSVLVIIPLLEKAFMPAVLGFMSLPEEGSSPDLEARIESSMNRTYFWVIAIYVVVFVAAYIGVAKP